MRINVTFVTSDKEFGQFVGLEKSRIVPKDSSKKLSGNDQVIFDVFSFIKSESDTPDNLNRSIFNSHSKYDGLIILVEEGMEEFAVSCRDYAFVWFYDGQKARKNTKNYINSTLAKAIRFYSALNNRFRDAKFAQAALLPFENFRAEELMVLRNAFYAQPVQPNLIDVMDQCVKNLRSRQSPKKTSSYSSVYYVDDRGKHFQYGHERHARPETSMPPHGFSCVIKSSYRFGFSYDPERHFNVSEDGKNQDITGTFVDCHGGAFTPKNRKHLNIFPSDQIA